jgi:hypothetical protein
VLDADEEDTPRRRASDTTNSTDSEVVWWKGEDGEIIYEPSKAETRRVVTHIETDEDMDEGTWHWVRTLYQTDKIPTADLADAQIDPFRTVVLLYVQTIKDGNIVQDVRNRGAEES